MLEIRNHYVTNEIVKLIKNYFINFEKIMKRLQLIIFKGKEKMSRNIRTIIVYIINDFKRVYNKTYSDFSASIRENLRAADLMIRDIRLRKNFQINAFFDDDFVESFSIIASRIDIIETDTSISSIRAVVSAFLISKIVFIISRKTSQAEKIDQLNKSNIVSFAVNLISS